MARITWQLLTQRRAYPSLLENQYLRSQPAERIAWVEGLAQEVQKPLKDPSDSPEEDFPQSLQNNTGWSRSKRFDDAPLIRAGDLIIIMDGGQHSPPRRELWSYHHPSFKTIPPKASFLRIRKCQPAAPSIDNSKLNLLTRSSRFSQRMYYCNVMGHNRTRQSRGRRRICAFGERSGV
jgi:hypothetical protein